MGTFEKLGLSEERLRILKQKGFEVPTPIQEKTIPAMMTGNKDIVGQAQTGTGKTAAFGLPIVDLLEEHQKHVQVLILTPTRELAIQVAEEINSFKGNKKIRIVPVYGGQSIGLQLQTLKKGTDIVVGTPGRILDHIRRKTLKLANISHLVLDEADEMLDMGFQEDVETIMEKTNPEKRTLLFSATMPEEILSVAKKYMKEYLFFKVTPEKLTAGGTDQIYLEVSESDKFEALCRIIDIEDSFYGLIFCRTRTDVDKVAHHLLERGYGADALHGEISQNLREKILNKFRKKIINILVATDVAARGIDVKDLSHVINYALPYDPKAYVHRVGRTGRAGKEGSAVTFITPEEYRKLQFIMRKTKTDIRRVKVPKVEDIIQVKKQKIKTDLEELTKTPQSEEYLTLASELLTGNNPEDILAALLKQTYGESLSEKNYAQIGSSSDVRGKTRLFVTHGRKNGLNRDKLINYIKEICNIPRIKIKDIQIFDNFSFISLPFKDAETVLSCFKKQKKGKGIFIRKASDKKK